MLPTTILLIRHGETAWNAVGRIQGSLDVPLSARGIWQAGRLADRLRRDAQQGLKIDAVISSDLARAQLTAEPLAHALGLPVTTDLRVRERRFGIFEGNTMEEVAAQYPQEFAQWRARDPRWEIPQGESGLVFIARVREALQDIAKQFAGGTVAAIAHGGVLDVAYRQAQQLAWDAPRLHLMLNASINRLSADAAPLTLRLIDWGDVQHLQDDAHAARDELA